MVIEIEEIVIEIGMRLFWGGKLISFRHRRSRSRSGSSGRKHKKSHKRDRSRERRDDKNGENHTV